MNTSCISVLIKKEWLLTVVLILIMMSAYGCDPQTTATVAVADTQPPAPTDTEVPPTDTAEPEPTETPTAEPTDTPEPTPTPTEEPTATPDHKATTEAKAAAAEEAVIADINKELEAIGFSTETGSLGWFQAGRQNVKMDPNNPWNYSPFAADLVAADFVLHTEATWESSGWAGCGFIFRSEPNLDEGAQYEFTTLRLSGLPAWQILYNKYGMTERGITTVLTAGAIDQDQGAMNKYLFIAEEGKFTLYINDQRIGSYYDYSVTRADGRFAFSGWQESGETTCSFENSWVWLLESEE